MSTPTAAISTSIGTAEAALSSALEAAGHTAHALAARDIVSVNAQRDAFLASAEAARASLLAAIAALEERVEGGGGAAAAEGAGGGGAGGSGGSS